MDTQQFLGALLSDNGKRCLFAAKGKKGDPKHRVRTKFYDTIPELITNSRAANKAGWDTWFGLFTFDDEGRRKADNALEVQSFFVDVDCGEDKPYYSQRDGAIALTAFCKRAGLPAPAQVNSGYGIHAYWILREPIPKDDWVPIAEKFKQLTIHHNFQVDNAVTADAARVLRLPGTLNYKYGDEKRCCIMGSTLPEPIDLSVIEEAVENAPITSPVKRSSTIDKLYRDEQAKLHANKVCKFRNIYDKTVAGAGCPQVEYLITNRATLEEPLWRAGLSLARVCEDTDKAVKILSKGYPGFNLPEAYKKMNETAAPYTCTTLNDLNPGVCDKCPIQNKRFDSPIALGMEFIKATEADNTVPANPKPPGPKPAVLEGKLEPKEIEYVPTVTIPTYPKPYFRAKDGGVYVRQRNVDKENNVTYDEIPVYEYDFYAVQLIDDPDAQECVVMHRHRPNDPVLPFTIPLKNIARLDTLTSTLAGYGIVSHNQKALQDYVMQWVKELQRTTAMQQARTQFGWDKTKTAFAAGDKLILEGGRIVANHPSTRTSGYFKYFEPKGTLAGWRKAMDFFNQPGMEAHQFVIGTAFGAPLVEFIANIQAGAMHIYSGDTGLGKTTAIWAAASVWGDYKELASNANDTKNSTLNRAEVWKNIALYVDELTNASPEVLSDYVLSISQGKQRNRMEGSANRERFRGDPWGLLAVSTGNTSISEKLSTQGDARPEMARMLEVHINEFTSIKEYSLDTKEFNRSLEGNYGHAGILFMQALQREKEFISEQVNNLVDVVEARLGLTYKDRFWSAYIACTIYGLDLAKKLGLHNFDMDGIWEFARKLIDKNKGVMKDVHMTTEDIVNEFVTEHYRDMLIINGAADGRSGPTIPDKEPTGKLLIRYEPDTDILAIRTTAIKNWCVTDRRINFGELEADLRQRYGAEQVQVRMNKGTKIDKLRSWCIRFKTDGFLKLDDADDSKT